MPCSTTLSQAGKGPCAASFSGKVQNIQFKWSASVQPAWVIEPLSACSARSLVTPAPLLLAWLPHEPLLRVRLLFYHQNHLHQLCCHAGDQITNGKPAPDIFLKAASLFDPPPEPSSCLVFEDAPAGVQAGVAAGMYAALLDVQHAINGSFMWV